jgi:hypothetical protein
MGVFGGTDRPVGNTQAIGGDLLDDRPCSDGGGLLWSPFARGTWCGRSAGGMGCLRTTT